MTQQRTRIPAALNEREDALIQKMGLRLSMREFVTMIGGCGLTTVVGTVFGRLMHWPLAGFILAIVFFLPLTVAMTFVKPGGQLFEEWVVDQWLFFRRSQQQSPQDLTVAPRGAEDVSWTYDDDEDEFIGL